VSEKVGAFLRAERAGNFADPATEPVDCSLCGLTQVGFDFAE
jgi:hypothetical protein